MIGSNTEIKYITSSTVGGGDFILRSSTNCFLLIDEQLLATSSNSTFARQDYFVYSLS